MIKFKPTTSSRRFLISLNNKKLWKGRPLKTAITKINSSGGRNNLGRLTVNGRSLGVKKKYRLIDFKRNISDICQVVRIEYDPNRSSNIALINYVSGKYSYIIAPKFLKIGDLLTSSSNAEIQIGNCLPLSKIPVGTLIHNIEIKPGKGGQIARSAGVYAVLVSKDSDKSYIKLSSSEIIVLNSLCLATIGEVSNSDRKGIKYGKAGRRRWLGFKPKVRGVAMNPIDHPHGGGEGKTSGGRHPVNKNGKLSKGLRTRNSKRTDKNIIKSRHKKN